MNTLFLAQRDIKIGSIPYRDATGQYQFSQGQLSIVNSEKRAEAVKINGELLEINHRLKYLESTKAQYGDQFQELCQAHEARLAKCKHEADRTEQDAKAAADEADNFSKDLLNRGIPTIPPPESPSPPEPVAVKSRLQKAWGRFNKNWFPVIKNLLLYAAVEGTILFTTYDALSETKSINQLIARFIIICLLVIAFDWTASRGREHPKAWSRAFYQSLTIVGYLALLGLIVTPLIIHHFFGNLIDSSSTASFDLSLDSTEKAEPKSVENIWLSFLAQYDYIIGIAFLLLSLLALKLDNQQKHIALVPPVPLPLTNQKKTDADVTRDQGILLLKSLQNNASKAHEKHLKAKAEYDRLLEHPDKYFLDLEGNVRECIQEVGLLKKRQADLNTLFAKLTTDLMIRLKGYETDFTDISTKRYSVLSREPAWATDVDVYEFLLQSSLTQF